MLPDRLLSYRRVDGDRIVPGWLTSRDDVWLRELCAELEASDGRTVDMAEDRLLELAGPLARRHGVAERVIEAIWVVERRRWGSRIDAPVRPDILRRAVFDLAATLPRDKALARAAAELGVDAEGILSALFADRAGARKLVAPSTPAVTSELALKYNLALAQSLLVRALDVVATLRGNVLSVVRFAKLVGLMTLLEQTEDGAVRIAVSGPLAIFHETVKYGRTLARWLPSVVSTPGWQVEARVLLRGETLRFELDGTAPLPRTQALPRAHDSKLEARFERELRRLGTKWRIERESVIVRVGDGFVYPDFTLVSPAGRVLVEIVGFWTPAYLDKKAALLAECTRPLVICADARHARGALATDPRVVLFEKNIDVPVVLAACERALARAGAATAPVTSIPRHYATLSPTGSVREHALRAGARADSWIEDVLSDLRARQGSAIRFARIAPHPSYGAQIALVGSRFHVAANPSRSREDALFIHRVASRTTFAEAKLEEYATELVRLDVHAVGDAPPLFPVRGLFEGRVSR